MLRTFNMGVGLILAVSPPTTPTVRSGRCAAPGEPGARVIGAIAAASPGTAPAVRYEA